TRILVTREVRDDRVEELQGSLLTCRSQAEDRLDREGDRVSRAGDDAEAPRHRVGPPRAGAEPPAKIDQRQHRAAMQDQAEGARVGGRQASDGTYLRHLADQTERQGARAVADHERKPARAVRLTLAPVAAPAVAPAQHPSPPDPGATPGESPARRSST